MSGSLNLNTFVLSMETVARITYYLERLNESYGPRGSRWFPDPNEIPLEARPGTIDPYEMYPDKEYHEYFFEHADEWLPKLLKPKTVEPTPLDPPPSEPPRPVSPPRDTHDTSGPEYLVLIGLPVHDVPEGWA